MLGVVMIVRTAYIRTNARIHVDTPQVAALPATGAGGQPRATPLNSYQDAIETALPYVAESGDLADSAT